MSTAPQQEEPSTLASPLLDKARRLGLSLPLDLERLAVMRGCDYYERDLGPRIPPLGEALLDLLPDVKVDTDRLPHPTRFVEMTGIDRGKVGVFTRWIRPRPPFAA